MPFCAPFALAIIIRAGLFSKGPRLIFKKCVSIDVTAGRLSCQVPASRTVKVPAGESVYKTTFNKRECYIKYVC